MFVLRTTNDTKVCIVGGMHNFSLLNVLVHKETAVHLKGIVFLHVLKDVITCM